MEEEPITIEEEPIIIDMANTKDDAHSNHVEVLQLMKWEHECVREGSPALIRSNETQRSQRRQATTKCQPPSNMPQLNCCESVFSSAATVVNFAHGRCAHAFSNSSAANLPTRARQFLSALPVLPKNQRSRACDVCQIVEQCRTHNLTIAWVGDSAHAQVWQGFIYELQRRNYTLSLDNNQTQAPGFWKTIIQYRETLTIHALSGTVTMNFFQVYILPLEHAQEREEIAQSGDILVLGWGLHWNSNDQDHKNSLPSALISRLSEFLSHVQGRRPQLVVHREASAQHFDGSAGDFSSWKNNPNRTWGCKPFTHDTKLTNWRERCVQEAAMQAGYQYTLVEHPMPAPPTSSPELVVLPFFNFTSEHYNQHPRDPSNDCTHYCPSPYLYMPLWRSLRLAVDRQFSKDLV